jgi:SAM-dependent methyltransferase
MSARTGYRNLPVLSLSRMFRSLAQTVFYGCLYSRWGWLTRRLQPLATSKLPRKDNWDSQYSRGDWDSLRDLREQAHYSVLAASIHHLKPRPSVLDIGCGEGLFYQALRPYDYESYVGIDLSEGALVSNRRWRDDCTHFIATDGESYQPTFRADVVVFCESLYYFRDPLAVVRRYRSYLKESGIFAISLVRRPQTEAIRRALRRELRIVDETAIRNAKGAWVCIIATPAELNGASHQDTNRTWA